MLLQLGMMRYINTLPFRVPLLEGAVEAPFTLKLDVPTCLNDKLRTGAIDVSLISTAEYLQNRNLYTLLPHFSITADKQVKSVLLYLRGSLRSLDNALVAVTPESASSVLLLRLFCRHFWGVSPTFVPLHTLNDLSDYEAVLLCGDTCLCNPHIAGFQVLDMAQIWYYATGLVFPFALFAARNDRMQSHAIEIEKAIRTLKQCLEWSSAHKERIEQYAVKNSVVPPQAISTYFHSLRYGFGEDEKLGMERFAALLESVSLDAPLEDFHAQTIS